MLYLNVWLTVKDPAQVETVRGLLVEAAKNSRQEPGCQRFEVYHSTADATRFLLNEHWESQEAVNAHPQGICLHPDLSAEGAAAGHPRRPPIAAAVDWQFSANGANAGILKSQPGPCSAS